MQNKEEGTVEGVHCHSHKSAESTDGMGLQEMMVLLRWSQPPQALLVIELDLGPLFVLIKAQLSLKTGGASCVHNLDFSGF